MDQIQLMQAAVARQVAEGDGYWRGCSGCREGVDGCISLTDYPYCPVFQCQPGSGCGECGGIGVIWESWVGLSDGELSERLDYATSYGTLDEGSPDGTPCQHGGRPMDQGRRAGIAGIRAALVERTLGKDPRND